MPKFTLLMLTPTPSDSIKIGDIVRVNADAEHDLHDTRLKVGEVVAINGFGSVRQIIKVYDQGICIRFSKPVKCHNIPYDINGEGKWTITVSHEFSEAWYNPQDLTIIK